MSNSDEQAIRETIALYTAGLRDGDVATLKQAFQDGATVTGYIGTEPFLLKPVQFLYEYVEGSPSPAKNGDPFEVDVRSVHVAGQTATAELAESAYLGDDYMTNLQFMQVDGRWWITSKLFSGTPTA